MPLVLCDFYVVWMVQANFLGISMWLVWMVVWMVQANFLGLRRNLGLDFSMLVSLVQASFFPSERQH